MSMRSCGRELVTRSPPSNAARAARQGPAWNFLVAFPPDDKLGSAAASRRRIEDGEGRIASTLLALKSASASVARARRVIVAS